MPEKNIFVDKLYPSLNISDFRFFLCKNWTPLKKGQPLFPSNSSLNIEILSSPPFWKLGSIWKIWKTWRLKPVPPSPFAPSPQPHIHAHTAERRGVYTMLLTNRPSQVFLINRNATVKLSSINAVHVKQQQNICFFIFKHTLKYRLGNAYI